MWNITNPAEFVRGEEKAKYVQKGPYTYIEVYSRHNVSQQYGAFENSSWIEYT